VHISINKRKTGNCIFCCFRHTEG